jgi:glycosyltransferase involved in cell wall biosynthesis
VFDAHEYHPQQRADQWYWRIFYSPMIQYLMRKYLPHVAASITVCEPIAARYRHEFHIDPIIVLNTPELTETPPQRPTDPSCIRLVHHGNAQWNRHLELMIEAMPLLRPEFELHLMLVDQDKGYINYLRELAAKTAPDRVFFHEPVRPSEIVSTISKFDIEIIFVPPVNYNYLMGMPNKLFEALHAGAAVCIGPSPAMRSVVEEYAVGWTASGFEANDLADVLNRLTIDEINAKRESARDAAKELNAERQLGKVLTLFDQLLYDRSSNPEA